MWFIKLYTDFAKCIGVWSTKVSTQLLVVCACRDCVIPAEQQHGALESHIYIRFVSLDDVGGGFRQQVLAQWSAKGSNGSEDVGEPIPGQPAANQLTHDHQAATHPLPLCHLYGQQCAAGPRNISQALFWILPINNYYVMGFTAQLINNENVFFSFQRPTACACHQIAEPLTSAGPTTHRQRFG